MSDTFRTVFAHLSTMKTKRNRFPLVIKRGSCTVKIYKDVKPQGTYYRVVYRVGAKRERLNFVNLDKAKLEAEAQAAKLSRGDVDAMQLTGKDRLVYGRALEAVKETGVTVDAAALEYSEAWKHLDGVSLVDAAKFYARHHGRGIKRKPVSEAVDEMIAAKKTSGVSELYLSDLRYRLGAFKAAFHCDVNALAPDDLAKFFNGLQLSARSYNNFLGTLGTFFAFAKKQNWLSREADLLGRVEKRKGGRAAPVEIFTPAQLADLLEHASSDLRPCLALAAFAGLRSEEILRLEWADVDRRPGFIELAAHKTKTATRRLVPITENLAAWIALAQRKAPSVWPHSKAWFFQSMRDTVTAINKKRKATGGPKAIPFVWKQNALRHSWITYRLAEIQNVNQVALEAGNSPQIIFTNYRELATPEQARSWFSIGPEAKKNVVPMRNPKAQANV
jgi:integrase